MKTKKRVLNFWVRFTIISPANFPDSHDEAGSSKKNNVYMEYSMGYALHHSSLQLVLKASSRTSLISCTASAVCINIMKFTRYNG